MRKEIIARAFIKARNENVFYVYRQHSNCVYRPAELVLDSAKRIYQAYCPEGLSFFAQDKNQLLKAGNYVDHLILLQKNYKVRKEALTLHPDLPIPNGARLLIGELIPERGLYILVPQGRKDVVTWINL